VIFTEMRPAFILQNTVFQLPVKVIGGKQPDLKQTNLKFWA
jgi:hypothetical protein